MGSFATPDGKLVFDLNDFDETIRGPWEWDVKRMVSRTDPIRLSPKNMLGLGRRLSSHGHTKFDRVVGRVNQILFRAQISFRSLN